TAMPVPSASAAPYAIARQCGGAKAAGARGQNAPGTSPETKEQFDGKTPPGSPQGAKGSVPPNCLTSIRRGRPPKAFASTLAIKPGARIIVAIRKTTVRPDIGSLRRGKISLITSAATAGATRRAPIQRPALRACISGRYKRKANLLWAGSSKP